MEVKIKKKPHKSKSNIASIKTVLYCLQGNVLTFMTIVWLFPLFLKDIHYIVQPQETSAIAERQENEQSEH